MGTAKRNIALLALATATVHTINSQSLAQWTTWGDAAFAKGEYHGASRFYSGALELEPGRMSLQWKQAEAYRLSNQYEQAAALYERVHRKDMGRSHPDALRWAGEMQMSSGAYPEAQRSWQNVLQKEKDKNSFIGQRARNALEGCDLALEVGPTDTVTIEHLPAPVNTYDSEFGARIGPDSVLYFSSLRGKVNENDEVQDTTNYHTSIYHSKEVGTRWENPIDLEPNGLKGDVANTTWTSDGQWMLFTSCPSGEACRIMIRGVPGRSDPKQLPGLGTLSSSTQPMVASIAGREWLYFVSDGSPGTGGMDIWLAELVDGTAVDPQPLGPPVNTPGNERSPWFEQHSRTLYFSSDFLPGLGGYDVFIAQQQSDGQFASPLNAGKPINSPANDLYPSYDPLRNEGWITSNRVGSFAAKGATCCNDLYRFRMIEPPVIGQLITPSDSVPATSEIENKVAQLQAEFPLKLYFHNDDPEPRSWKTSTDQDYGRTFDRYRSLLPEYDERNEDKDHFRRFFSEEVERGQMQLAKLAMALAPVLENGEQVTLEVRGFASPLARNDYNANLSLRRIESLRNYLQKANSAALAPYMDSTASNGGILRIRALPFGEDRSASNVSDDLRDQERSVYSVPAARERRIEVERILLEPGEREVIFPIGTVHQGEERIFKFAIYNSSSVPLRILEANSDCDCTVGRKPEAPIAPGGTGDLEVVFTGRSRPGPLERRIIEVTDGSPETIIVLVRGTVVE